MAWHGRAAVSTHEHGAWPSTHVPGLSCRQPARRGVVRTQEPHLGSRGPPSAARGARPSWKTGCKPTRTPHLTHDAAPDPHARLRCRVDHLVSDRWCHLLVAGSEGRRDAAPAHHATRDAASEACGRANEHAGTASCRLWMCRLRALAPASEVWLHALFPYAVSRTWHHHLRPRRHAGARCASGHASLLALGCAALCARHSHESTRQNSTRAWQRCSQGNALPPLASQARPHSTYASTVSSLRAAVPCACQTNLVTA
jgi:hypothetical protein